MIKRVIAAAVVLAGLSFAGSPANAMCIPGRIGIDPKTHKVIIELPKCNPPPQAASNR